MNLPVKRDIGSLVISLVFVLIGLVVLYDTTGYSDRDSKIFPRAAAIALILASVASCIGWMLRPAPVAGFGDGNWWRRLLLVGSMLVAALLMPRIGFLPAGILVFAGGLVAGMENRWTPRALVLYGTCSVVIVTAFYALFKYALYVPLP